MTGPPFAYSVYGLAVSSDLELPGLRPSSGLGTPVAIAALEAADCPMPSGEAHFRGGFETLWHLDREEWVLRYSDESPQIRPWSIRAGSRGARLTVHYCAPDQLHDIRSLMVGPGLALPLHIQGAFVLHASAVETGGKAILLIGDSGAGKSTTAAALVRRGFRLVSDDISAIEMEHEPISVHSGPSRLRIYEDSARAAGWAGSLPRLFRHPVFDDKRYIELDPDDGCPDLTPIAAICVLQPRGGGADTTAVERLPPRAALGALLNNLYCARFLDPSEAPRAAGRCAALAAGIPILAVHRPDDLSALAGLADAIAAHVTRPPERRPSL